MFINLAIVFDTVDHISTVILPKFGTINLSINLFKS